MVKIKVEPAMDGSGSGENTTTQGFDNPAFDKKDSQQTYSEKAAAKSSTNGDAPAPAVYTSGDVVDANNQPRKDGKISDEEVDPEVEAKNQERRDKEPLKFISLIVNNLGLCFGLTLAGHVSMLLITAILFQVGYDIIPIEFDRLPLDIRGDVDYLREVAWLERNVDDNNIIARGEGDANIVQDERTIIFEQLDMLFEKKGGNVFTQENLKAIKEAEDAFMNNQEFQNDFCLLAGTPPTCSKPSSVIRFFDGTYTSIGLSADLEFTDIPLYMNTIQSTPALRRTLVAFLGEDAEITATKAESSITRVLLPIGGPLSGYSNTSHEEDEQAKKYETFLLEDFRKIADDYYNDKVGPDKMDFFYLSGTMFSVTILRQVVMDMALAVGSFFFIGIFLLIQTGSFWITGFAVFSVITCFLGSNLIYRVIIDIRYFGIFHVLALFIILGIGADDIFVFLDTWKESAYHKYKSLAHRMSDVYRRASIAMLFTSLTTAVAFFVSAGSPFLAISSFGVFSGVLIFFNYLSVIIFFPCVVLMHHRYFEKNRCCCCCPRDVPATDGEAQDGHPTGKRKNFVVRFFSGPYYRFVTHKIARWVILGGFAVLLGVFIYFASQLQVNDEQIKFFSESTNVGKYLDRSANAFTQLGNDRAAQVHIVFGLKPQDLSTCHKSDAKCMGKTVWDDNFNLDSVAAQNDIIDLCDDLVGLDSTAADELHIKKSVSDGVTLEVLCFMHDMRDAPMAKAGGYPTFPYTQDDWTQISTFRSDIYTDTSFSSGFSDYFALSMGYWIYDEFNGTNVWRNKYDSYLGEVKDTTDSKTTSFVGQYGSSETAFYGTRLRYATIVINTTLSATQIGYSEGLKVRDRWEELITTKLSEMSSKDTLEGFQTTGGLWHWLKVQEQLVSNAVLGIAIGLAVALPILIIATHNVLVGLLATLVICCVTVSVIGVIPAAGWKLGLLESLNLVLVVGLSVDYVVHLAEGYSRSAHKDRKGRVRDALEEVGISVLSGACTTLGASFFLLFAVILFFTEFGIFMFSTIGFSISYALGLFITLLGLIGPEGETGSLKPLYRKIAACCCKKKE